MKVLATMKVLLITIAVCFLVGWKVTRGDNKLSVTTSGTYELVTFGKENIRVKTVVSGSRIGFVFIDGKKKYIKAKTSRYNLTVTRSDGDTQRYTISTVFGDRIHWVNNSTALITYLKKALGKSVKVTMSRPDGRAYYHFRIPVRGFTKAYNGFIR